MSSSSEGAGGFNAGGEGGWIAASLTGSCFGGATFAVISEGGGRISFFSTGGGLFFFGSEGEAVSGGFATAGLSTIFFTNCVWGAAFSSVERVGFAVAVGGVGSGCGLRSEE